MFKRISAILLALVMMLGLFALSACTTKPETPPNNDKPSENTTPGDNGSSGDNNTFDAAAKQSAYTTLRQLYNESWGENTGDVTCTITTSDKYLATADFSNSNLTAEEQQEILKDAPSEVYSGLTVVACSKDGEAYIIESKTSEDGTTEPDDKVFYFKDGDKYICYSIYNDSASVRYVSANAGRHGDDRFQAQMCLEFLKVLREEENFEQLSSALEKVFIDSTDLGGIALTNISTSVDITKDGEAYCLTAILEVTVTMGEDSTKAKCQITIPFTDTTLNAPVITLEGLLDEKVQDTSMGGTGTGYVIAKTKVDATYTMSFSNAFDATKMEKNYQDHYTGTIGNAWVSYTAYVNGYKYSGGSFDFTTALVLADNEELAVFEWYLDEDCTQKAPATITVSESYEKVTLYAKATTPPAGTVEVIKETSYGSLSIDFVQVGETITASYYGKAFITINDGEEFELTETLTFEAGKRYKIRYAD